MASSSPSATDAAVPAKRRAPVYRVRGVPPELHRASLLTLLESHKDLSGCGLGIHTLAADIGGSQTATIFFAQNKIPPRLAALERRGALAVEIVVNATPESAGAKRERHGPQAANMRIDALLLGLTTLYTPPKKDHHFDVLAVHGLGGSHPYGSFVSYDDGHMWLKDDLPRIIPSARVMIYGYDTKLPENPDCAKLVDLGGGLRLAMIGLWQDARPASTKPLVLVGLSLGGLLVKEALIQLSDSSLWSSELGTVRGVLLFGAPNDGMNMKSLWPIVQDNSNRLLLDSLNPINPHELINQKPAFARLLRRASLELFCFWEQLPSPVARMTPSGSDNNYSMDGEPQYMVTKISATSCLPPGAPSERVVGLQTTHSGLVKFRCHDPEFEKVKPILIHMCDPCRGAAVAHSLPLLTPAEKACQAALSFARRETPDHEIKDAVAGTCEWLFAHQEYKLWHSSPKGLLWVKGIAGSGKSTLLRYTLGRIKALSSAGEAPIVLDFFFDRQGNKLQKSSLGLFRSLVHQVLTRAPRALATFVDAFQRHSAAEQPAPDDAVKWSEYDLKVALRSSLAAVLQERPVWLLIDALDEADDEATAVGVVDEFKALLDRVSDDGFPLRIIFTARQHLVLDGDYGFEIAVQGNNEADIATFVAARLSTNRSLKESSIGELITERAAGLFLWAALVVDRAHTMHRHGRGLVSIRRMIHDTPAKLAALYRQMLDELAAEERPLTRKLFQWMCFAKRPMKVDELKWALIVGAEGLIESCTQFEDHDEFDSDMATRIVYISRGLVKTESKRADSSPSAQHFVRFIHQSVVDFLLREGGLASMHDGQTLASADIAQHAHYQLSRTCIRYLRMKKIAQLPAETLQEWAESGTLWSTFPLFEYASVAWPSHTQRGYQHGLVSSMGWPSDPFFNRWLLIYCRVWPRKHSQFRCKRHQYEELAFMFLCPPENMNVGHFAAQYGLTELLLEALPPRGRVAVDAQNNFGRTPLFYAALNGYGRLVAALLNAGADPCVRDHSGRDALSFAAQCGHADVASDLLSKGAGVNARDSFGATALHWAALGQDQDTMRLLLRRGADVGAKARDGSTPLEWAIVVGHEAGVATLLAAGSAVNYSNQDWRFTFGLDSWVNCVCEEKGILNIHLIDGGTRMWTPLSLAVRKGVVAIVKLLLDKGASPNLAAESGPLPLSLARELGNEEMISLLEARASKSKELSIMLGSNTTM
ncbi:hypothetical protein MY5147_007441 [Beauveria neobassiana]|uniref:Nephrocystin 3-like N-terminal domain-containing protein n=1 Tax=Beauveria bassiana TaxID=176275 RepID=A0A2S7XZ10_BEABA|nr:hypothetical protein BB8028_0001g11910 [Beauveria bassiana]